MDWSTELRYQNLTKAQAKTRADEAKNTIEILRKDLKPVKKQLTAAEKTQTAVAKQYELLSEGVSTTTSTTTSKPATITSMPSLESPAMHDYVESTSLKTLLQDVVNPDQELSIGSTDRGLKCMSLTTPNRWNTLLDLGNRFHVLYPGYTPTLDNDSIEPSDVLPSGEAAGSSPSDQSTGEQDLAAKQRLLAKYNPSLPKKQLLEVIKFPKPVKITAQQVQHMSGGRRIAKRRETALRQNNNKDVRDASTLLSQNSLHRGQTAEEIEQAQTVSRSQRQVLREFEQAPARTKDRHRLELQQKRAWAVLSAMERTQVKDITP
ncbi:hypothetical protein EC957_012463, partial [Mortierella hygrophila]